MTQTKRVIDIEKERNKRSSDWFSNFFVMGGWILVMIVALVICGLIRAALNY
jgi:hypothetical protein